MVDRNLKENKMSVYEKYGGLIIFGVLFIIGLVLLLISKHLSALFLNVLKPYLNVLPIAFAAALTVRLKGLDLSVPGMVALCSVLMNLFDSLLVGIIISLIICCAIGILNSIIINHFKLPGALVTFSTLMVIVSITDIFSGYFKYRPYETGEWDYLIVIAVSIVFAFALVFLSKKVSNRKKELLNTLIIYSGSGVFAVLYYFAKIMRFGVVSVPCDVISLISMVIFTGVFYAATRFYKSKVFDILFAFFTGVTFSFYSLWLIYNNISIDWQGTFFGLIIIIMMLIIFHKGRASFIGSSPEQRYIKKTWIALAPMFLYAVKTPIIYLFFLATKAYNLTMLLIEGFSVVLAVLAISICATYITTEPRDMFLKE